MTVIFRKITKFGYVYLWPANDVAEIFVKLQGTRKKCFKVTHLPYLESLGFEVQIIEDEQNDS